MRVLVTWGSKAGGTEGIARIVGHTLREAGHDVTMLPAREVSSPVAFDAVLVGGALYAFHWHRDALRLVDRHVAALRRIPVWFFSSGPLDDSADRRELPPVEQVRVLMERVGAQGHVTFGGRLAADARGLTASAMAKQRAGDFRNPERIRTWASEVARALPTAAPGHAVEPPGRSIPRLLLHGLVGAAACALVLAGLASVASRGTTLALHAVAAPAVFVVVALHYFRGHGARAPFPSALVFGATVLAVELALTLALPGRTPGAGVAAVGLPALLVILAAWCTGAVRSFMPIPPRSRADAPA